MASGTSRFFLARLPAILGRTLFALTLVAAPWLLLAGLLHIYCGARITDALPGDGDFTFYWHEIATYAAVGFRGGYYGFEELVAPATRLGLGGFGAHSAFFPMLFGIIGRFVGWGLASGTIFSLSAVSLGLAGFVLLLRKDFRLQIWAGALLLTNILFFIYIARCSPEGVHIACGFLFAALFIRHFEAATPQARRTWFAVLYIVIFLAALLRYSWGLVFLPLFFTPKDVQRWPGRETALRGLACLASIAATYVLYNLFMAPYPYEPFPGSAFGLPVYLEALKGDIRPLWTLITTNAKTIFAPRQPTFTDAIVYVYLAFLVINALALSLRLVFLPRDDTACRKKLRFTLFFLLTTMVPLLLLCFCYYYVSLGGIGAKILLPVFTMSYLVTARYMPVPAVPVALVFFLGLAPMALQTFQKWTLPDYDTVATTTRQTVTQTSQALLPLLAYTPGVDPWCNTVVTLDNGLPPAYTAIPAGVAFQILRYAQNGPKQFRYTPWHKERGILSHYILTQNPRDIEALSKQIPLTFLADTPIGRLYRNEASACRNTGRPNRQ
ncbi:hypothetical protein [Solidesulfovibrio sp. C21]|uniref:hypothetical protein n=1 Tax=Solidesulfovibrio sp. C21 TaxID=3398613 RepID=UPI0039FBB572